MSTIQSIHTSASLLSQSKSSFTSSTTFLSLLHRLDDQQTEKQRMMAKQTTEPIYSRPNPIRSIISQARSRPGFLSLATLITTLVAITLGLLIRGTCSEKWTQRSLMYLEFPGQLYMRALNCLSIPIIIAGLVSALANLNPKLAFRIGKRTTVYYLGTSLLAIILGVILVLILRPGAGDRGDFQGPPMSPRKITSEDAVLDLLRNAVPANVFTTFFNQDATYLTAPTANQTTDLSDPASWPFVIKQIPSPNILGLIIVSLVFGLFVGSSHRTSNRPLLRMLFNDLIDMILQMANYILLTTPVGVIFLIMPKIIAVENLGAMLQTTGLFAVTVLVGLALHGLIILPGIYFFFTKKDPYKFMIRQSEALLTAFGTSSSAASVPATIKCLEENEHLDRDLVRMTVPIGAAVNMDGTALYEAVAAIFLAQLRSVAGLDLAKILAVSLTTIFAVTGATGIPHAGIITLTMVLSSLGVPPEDLALILAIDWLLHRFRTVVNVFGDLVGAAIVNHRSLEDLASFQAVEATQQQQAVGDVENQLVVDPVANSKKGDSSQGIILANGLTTLPSYENVQSMTPSPESEKIASISFSRLSNV